MTKQKSIFQQVGESIKAGAAAIVDVAQTALTAASDLPNDGGYKPVKNQHWVKEIEASKSSKKKSKKKASKKAVKKTGKKSKKKSKKKKL